MKKPKKNQKLCSFATRVPSNKIRLLASIRLAGGWLVVGCGWLVVGISFGSETYAMRNKPCSAALLLDKNSIFELAENLSFVLTELGLAQITSK